MRTCINPNWPRVIKLLVERGYSQSSLAKKLGVDQSTVCRLSDGRIREPKYSVGVGLIDLAGGVSALEVAGVYSAERRPVGAAEPATAGGR